MDLAARAHLHHHTHRRTVLPTISRAHRHTGATEQPTAEPESRPGDAEAKTHPSPSPGLPGERERAQNRARYEADPPPFYERPQALRRVLYRYAAMSIPPYEPPKSTPSHGAANTLLCPKCAGVMKTYERNGIHLEQCDTCRGIFLDFGELESLTQMENRFAQAAPPPPPPLTTGTATMAPAGGTAATSTTASRDSAGCSSPARTSAAQTASRADCVSSSSPCASPAAAA